MAGDTQLLSYVIVRDFGFAPNPFHGHCTLGTCISTLRSSASVGDVVMATATRTGSLSERLVYAMEVAEILSFNEYWADQRFARKRPQPNGSRKYHYGDNIYFRREGNWQQAFSHHSLPDGRLNPENVNSDTAVDKVLIAHRFVYWGNQAIEIPPDVRFLGNEDVVHRGIGFRKLRAPALTSQVLAWLRPQLTGEIYGRPFSW